MLRRRTWWTCCLSKVHRRLLRRVGQAVVVHCELVLCAAIKRRYVCKQKSQEGPRQVQTTFSRANGGLKCSTALLSSMINVSGSPIEHPKKKALRIPAYRLLRKVFPSKLCCKEDHTEPSTSQPTVWIRSGTSLLSLCDQASTSNWQEQRRRSKGAAATARLRKGGSRLCANDSRCSYQKAIKAKAWILRSRHDLASSTAWTTQL